MIQLRKQDVRPDQAGWVMRLTPEAGGIKNNTFRDVPIHQHLIALGFLDLVERAKDGPLFCELGKYGTTTGPAEGVYKRVLELVRSAVPDPKVQPNHAWRYTFKTYGYEAGLDHLTLDAICGHAAKTKGNDYTKVTLKKRMEAMASFPRYKVTGTTRSAAA
jgi:integrase